ncbi:MAG: M23 family metallopeptidase [Clostridia bacterium]|nr:M23 family metallopeptidase [Clostridia bacterium]
MLAPYKGKFKVTQEFKNTHDGLDLVGLDSKTVYSTVEGVVEKAGWENALNHKQGFGLYVRIKQNNSVDRYYFGHLSQLKCKKGDKVKVGTPLGVEGNTGYSFGSHCHYCVRGNGSKAEVRDINKISGIPNKRGTYIAADVTSNVTYRVKAGGKWLPEVIDDNDYAGIKGKAITDVAIKVSSGKIRYRVHTYKGKWLPYVSGYDITDSNNGYAGNGKPIDAIEIDYTGADGKKILYRVAPLKKSYFSWQTDNLKVNGLDGYAGLLGRKIDKLQIVIK